MSEGLVKKIIPEGMPSWLTVKRDLSFQTAIDFRRTDLVAALREQLSYYPKRIVFLLLKPEWREVFRTNPQIDDVEKNVINELLFGDCKTQEDRDLRWAELEHEEAQWELQVWKTQGIKDGHS